MSLQIRFGPDGLAPAIAQDARTGRVLMTAFMDQEAWEATLATREAHFHSRSRARLWKKGETSGHVLHVLEVWVDCDADAVLLLVEPAGPACHTGEVSCFFDRKVGDREGPASPELARLEAVIESRRSAAPGSSYVRTLLDGGPVAVSRKVTEEAGELARAVESESDDRVVSEAADLLFHATVALASRGLSWASVLAELSRRSGTSGLAEKAGRSRPTG